MAQQAPTLLRYVDAEPSNCGYPSFGYTWQERVGEVRRYQIFTSTIEKRVTIADVKNLSAAEANQSDLLHLFGCTYAFLLLPDEHVKCVEVYYIDDHAIIGLRFHTDKRHHGSLWRFWACRRYYRCIRVGAVFAPLSAPTNADKLSPRDSDTARSAIVRARGSPSRVLDAYRSAPRAIVVHADRYVSNIPVASADEYAAYVALDGCVSPPSENWFVLAEHERVEAVGVGIVANCGTNKLCFHTNYRTSPWFGGRTTGETTSWLDCADHPGAFICSFQVESVGEMEKTLVTGVGVIYSLAAQIVGETVVETVAAEEVSKAA